MTNSNSKNALENSIKNDYIDKDKSLEMFRPLLEDLNYSNLQKNLSTYSKNSYNHYLVSLYRTFI